MKVGFLQFETAGQARDIKLIGNVDALNFPNQILEGLEARARTRARVRSAVLREIQHDVYELVKPMREW